MKKYLLYSLGGTAIILGGFMLIGWRRKAANLAVDFIDQKEIGNNQGFSDDVFEHMIKSVGWKGGEAWCMYFAKAVWMLAFAQKKSVISKYFTGSTQVSWKNAIDNPEFFKVITSGKPMAGDIVIWQSVTNPTVGHAGIVKKKDHGDYYQVIEGNTSLNGVREGQGVQMHERRLVPGYVDGELKVLGFIRLRL